MCFKYLIYFMMIYVCVMSLVTLIYSIINKNKFVSKLLIPFSIIYIFHFLYFILLIDAWYIPIGLEILFIYIFMIIAVILYIISIIVDIVKVIKAKMFIKSNKYIVATISLILLPSIILFSCFFIEKGRLANSDFIVVYESRGNGGIGDGDTFAYAISDDKCFKFDLGIEIGGSYLGEFLPDKFEEIEFGYYEENDALLDNYVVPYYDYNYHGDLVIYKNDKEVCKIDTYNYFNIELETIYK